MLTPYEWFYGLFMFTGMQLVAMFAALADRTKRGQR